MQVPGVYKIRYIGQTTLSSAAVSIVAYALSDLNAACVSIQSSTSFSCRYLACFLGLVRFYTVDGAIEGPSWAVVFST